MTQRIFDTNSPDITQTNTPLPDSESPSPEKRNFLRRGAPLAILFTSDLAALVVAAVAASSIGAAVASGAVVAPVTGPLAWFVLIPLLLTVLAVSGVYSSRVSASIPRVALRSAGVLSFVAMAAGLGLVLSAHPADTMAYAALVWFAAVLFVPVGRLVSKPALRLLQSPKVGQRAIVVAGPPAEAEAAVRMVQGLGGSFRIVGVIKVPDTIARNGSNGRHESADNLAWAVWDPALPAAEVLISAPPSQLAHIEDALRPALHPGTPVYFNLAALTEAPGGSRVEIIDDDLPAVRLRPRHDSWHYAVLKRWMDLFIASTALVVAAPLMLLIAAAIKLDSPGGVMFKQTRMGQNRRLFSMYKFRSMRIDAEAIQAELMAENEAQGPLFKIKDDPRMTRVGKIIRRLSLDELPQLINVLQGSMSIVGPRPPLPQEVMQYQIWHLRRLDVKPGITGLWQVSRSDTSSFDEMIEMDMAYVEGWSLTMDIKILLKTLPAMVMARGAY